MLVFDYMLRATHVARDCNAKREYTRWLNSSIGSAPRTLLGTAPPSNDPDAVFGYVILSAAVGLCAVTFVDYDFQKQGQDKAPTPTWHPCAYPDCMHDFFASMGQTGFYRDYMYAKSQLWQHPGPSSIEEAAC